MSESPSLVLIAGSWHLGKCFERITTPLQEVHGFKCQSITLPSTQGDPQSTFKDDLDAARSAIEQEVTQGRDVIVIAHSFGGMVGNSAIKGLTRPMDSSSQPTGYGRVIGLILIASGFTLTGLSFMDPMFGIPPPSWRVNKETEFAELVQSPRELFYHDLTAEDAEYWVSQLQKQNLKAMFEGGEHAYAGWMDVPVYYIGTREDRGLPCFIQRMQVGMARAMGDNVEHRELQSSHSPFLSMPDECVEIILEAISAFTPEETTNASSRADVQGGRSRKVFLPAVRLSQPSSWFRYGLPLGVGRFLGNCINIYGWIRRRWR